MRSEKDLLDSAKKYSFRGRVDKSVFSGPVFVRGEGSTVEDVNGKQYLDFNSGQMCSALGHNHPIVTDAIKKSCDELIHAHSSFFNDQEIILAERLGALLPPPLEKSLFLGSGADANEAAVTIARKFTDGFEVASPHISFHGLSDTARSLTFAGWHSGHGPLSPGSMAMVAPYCYRCPLAQKFPDCEIACLDTSFELIDAQTTSKPAAVITEPLFSAGGVVEPPPGWLKKLKENCEERDMLLIVDDEQTGLGKLGTMFGFEKDEVVPDVVTLAKHFGGGVSISSVSTSAEVEEKIASTEFVVTHSHTNDPLASQGWRASTSSKEKTCPPRREKSAPTCESASPGWASSMKWWATSGAGGSCREERGGQAHARHQTGKRDQPQVPGERAHLQPAARGERPSLRAAGHDDGRPDGSGDGHPHRRGGQGERSRRRLVNMIRFGSWAYE